MHSLSIAVCILAVGAAASPALDQRASVPIETRSIADIYAAAQKEDGNLNVAWGGDGEPTSTTERAV